MGGGGLRRPGKSGGRRGEDRRTPKPRGTPPGGGVQALETGGEEGRQRGGRGPGGDAAARHKPGRGRRRWRLYLRARPAREIGLPRPRPGAPRAPLARPWPGCAAPTSAAVNIRRPTTHVRATARLRVRPGLALKGATALLVGPGAVPALDFPTAD